MTIDEFIEVNNITIFVEVDLQNKMFLIRKMELEHELEEYGLFDLFEKLILYKDTKDLLEDVTGQLMPRVWKHGATHCALCYPNYRRIVALFYDTDMDEKEDYFYAKELDLQIKELFNNTEDVQVSETVSCNKNTEKDFKEVKKFSKKIAAFLSEVTLINWFEHCGIPNGKYHMVFSLFEAFESWGKQYIEVWEDNTYALEDIAIERIGDDKIDGVFEIVSAAIGNTIWNKLGDFVDRQHLEEERAVCSEFLDMVKRDMAWGCIERILDMPGFFTMLIEVYKDGYLPCSWMGEYPSGQVVVL